jgi:hypothetical protein
VLECRGRTIVRVRGGGLRVVYGWVGFKRVSNIALGDTVWGSFKWLFVANSE